MNARSIKNKTDQIELILKSSKLRIHIIIVSETWLRPGEEKFVNIPDYNACYVSRDKHGGGVGIFIDKMIPFKMIKEHNSDLSMLTVNIVNVKLNVTVVYRPPDYKMNDFLQQYENFLESVSGSKNIVIGDFNLDLLKNTDATLRYREIYRTYDYHILNETMPTRMSNNPSLIDHVASNFESNDELSLMDHSISDHRLQVLGLPKPKQPYRKAEKKYKVFQNIDYPEARKQLVRLTQNLHQFTDPTTLYDRLEEIFINNRHVQVKEVYRVVGKEWISQKSLLLMKKRDRYYKKLKKQGTDYYKRKHEEYSGKVKKQIKYEKKSYYKAEFGRSLGDAKKTWRTVNRIIHNKSQASHSSVPSLKENGALLTEPKDISNSFNHFFINVGQDLSGGIQHIPVNRLDSVRDSLFFSPVTAIEVENIISLMDKNKACGVDSITVDSVQHLKTEVSIILTKLINLSLQDGVVPDKLKIARVKPLFKKGDCELSSNYRPVSVLPIFSKVLEVCVNGRLQSFLVRNDFLYGGQYGFCRGRDTETAVLDLISDLQMKMDRGLACSLVSLDLQKAFDTVDHDIMLVRLGEAGIRGVPYHWFKNYLLNRKQYVSVNNVNSSLETIRCGVPQGSVLGPTLFLIYINSIGKLSLRGNIKLYADDTTLVYYGTDVEMIKSDICNDLSQVSTWLKSHKLTANVEKSSYMFLSRKNLNGVQHNILFENQQLQNTSVIKYVGLLIDSTLSWSAHIDHIRKKIAPFVGLLFKVGYLLTKKLRKQLYYAHIYSHLHYLISVWGTAANCILNPLRVLQNKSIKNVFKLPLRYHTEQLYKMSKFLNINQIYRFKTILYIYYISKKYKGSNISFVNVPNIHNYHTRQVNDIYLTRVRSNIGLNSIYHRGVKLYNDLPLSLRSITKPVLFKGRLREFILNLI